MSGDVDAMALLFKMDIENREQKARIKKLEKALEKGIYMARIFGEQGSMDNWSQDAEALIASASKITEEKP